MILYSYIYVCLASVKLAFYFYFFWLGATLIILHILTRTFKIGLFTKQETHSILFIFKNLNLRTQT